MKARNAISPRLARLEQQNLGSFSIEHCKASTLLRQSQFGIMLKMMCMPSYSKHDVILVRYPF